MTTENGDQQDRCNLTTIPCVQRSLYLNEMTNNFSNIQVEVPKEVDDRTQYVLEQCMTTCGKAAGMKAKNNPGLTTKFSILLIGGRSNRGIM